VNVKGGCFFRETTPFFKILSKRNVMANRKHKPKQAAHQKVEQAQHRNEFILHFNKWIDDLANDQVSQLIPKQEYDYIYKTRIQSIKIINSLTRSVASPIFDEFKRCHTALLKLKQIEFTLDNAEKKAMSYYHFFTIGMTIHEYVIRLTETRFTGAGLIMNHLKSFNTYYENEAYLNVSTEYCAQLNMLCLLHNNLQTQSLSYHLNFTTELNGKSGARFYVELTGLETEKINVLLDEHRRPVHQLGIAEHGPLPRYNYITIAAKELNLNSNQLFSVYVQSHAFNRLTERIDGIFDGILHFNLYHSFKNIQVHSDKHGGYLFEFSINQIKVGYFKGEIIGENIVLRTFLFLTNNGTPEGKKLHANIGIMKEDKIYLTIDKLSTFVNSDIASNERLKQVFIDAGCESLFRIDKNFFYEEGGVKTKTIADHITRYLKLDA
jgi:hypothetical protein